MSTRKRRRAHLTAMFPHRLTTCIEASGLSIYAWAAKHRIHRGSLGHLTAGTRRPSAEMVAKLSLACGVTSDYLLGLTDKPHPTVERGAGEVTVERSAEG